MKQRMKMLVLAALAAGYSAYAFADTASFYNPTSNPSKPGGCASSRYFEVNASINESWTIPELSNGQAVVVYSAHNMERSFECVEGTLYGGDWSSGGDFEYI